MKSSITNFYNLKKSFYKEHARVEKRSWDEIEKFLNLHQIKFSGFDFPKPIYALDEINFPDYVLNELKLQGINKPTAIQSMTWPAIYSGRDIMCIGLPTASRVLSYICPALVFLREQQPEVRQSGPLVLIVTQTKEVAREIFIHSQVFISQAQAYCCCLFDDENIHTQSAQLRENEPDILIANYHRLCELLDNELVNLKNVSFLIMDDFYRNRSARLSDEIKRVVNETKVDRQTIIFSRIIPSGLQKSNGDEFQNDALFVCIGNDDIHVPNRDMPQTIHICTMAEKRKKLQDIINEIAQHEKTFKILIYANGFKKIRITEKIVKELKIDTFAYERTTVGKRRRAMKEKVYYNFNATPNSVLVASDVVSSKVELPDLNYIINADFPVNLSLYLNRMRMPNVKKYISIFIAEDARHADRLIYVLNECRQPVPSILYKISEAYVNSGKDVDRMPSLVEISDGITKPVEKPIPKPLPPTISLNVETTPTLTMPSSEFDDSGCVEEMSSPVQKKRQLNGETTELDESDLQDKTTTSDTTVHVSQSESPNDSTSNVTSELTATNGQCSTSSITISAVSASSASTSSSSLSSSLSSSSSSSSSSYSSSSSSSSSTQPPSGSSFSKRFKTFHPRPSNFQSMYNQNHSNNHRLNYLEQSKRYPPNNNNQPYYVHQQPTPVYGYQTVQTPPAATVYPQYYSNPQPTGYVYNSNSYYYQQNGAYYQHPIHHNHHPPMLTGTYGAQTYTAPQYAQQSHYYLPPNGMNQTTHTQAQIAAQSQSQSYNNGQPIQPQKQPELQIKNEPVESPMESTPTHHNHLHHQQPYFRNPIPFKQEPSEQQPTTSNDNRDAINIVSTLLKDKKILNQLEKVAQSFRLN